MKINVIKSFKWCVGRDIYPTNFDAGVQEIDEEVAKGAIAAGWAEAIEKPEQKEPAKNSAEIVKQPKPQPVESKKPVATAKTSKKAKTT